MILGVTGGIGSGKSTVLSYLEKHYNAALILLDDVARKEQSPGGRCYDAMVSMFPEEAAYKADGTLDRAYIAGRIFSNDALLAKMNAIVHPVVFDETKRLCEEFEQEGRALIVIESALLTQSGYKTLCDEIWYVSAPKDIRAARLQKDRGYTAERIENTMAAQLLEEEYRTGADFVLLNDATIEELYLKIDERIDERLHP